MAEFTTKFQITEIVYFKHEAEKGNLVPGRITDVQVRQEVTPNIPPVIVYWVDSNLEMVRPGGWYEQDLLTEIEAKQIAKAAREYQYVIAKKRYEEL